MNDLVFRAMLCKDSQSATTWVRRYELKAQLPTIILMLKHTLALRAKPFVYISLPWRCQFRVPLSILELIVFELVVPDVLSLVLSFRCVIYQRLTNKRAKATAVIIILLTKMGKEK